MNSPGPVWYLIHLIIKTESVTEDAEQVHTEPRAAVLYHPALVVCGVHTDTKTEEIRQHWILGRELITVNMSICQKAEWEMSQKN